MNEIIDIDFPLAPQAYVITNRAVSYINNYSNNIAYLFSSLVDLFEHQNGINNDIYSKIRHYSLDVEEIVDENYENTNEYELFLNETN